MPLNVTKLRRLIKEGKIKEAYGKPLQKNFAVNAISSYLYPKWVCKYLAQPKQESTADDYLHETFTSQRDDKSDQEEPILPVTDNMNIGEESIEESPARISY